MAAEPHPQPPQPPDMRRRFQLYSYQYIGIPLLMLLPILALLGILSEKDGEAAASAGGLALTVAYPERAFFSMSEQIAIEVENTSDAPVARVTVYLDLGYLDAFREFSFRPSVTRVTQDNVEIELRDLEPGETRAVTVDMVAEKYGLHTASVAVFDDAGMSVEADIATTIFP